MVVAYLYWPMRRAMSISPLRVRPVRLMACAAPSGAMAAMNPASSSWCCLHTSAPHSTTLWLYTCYIQCIGFCSTVCKCIGKSQPWIALDYLTGMNLLDMCANVNVNCTAWTHVHIHILQSSVLHNAQHWVCTRLSQRHEFARLVRQCQCELYSMDACAHSHIAKQT